MTELYKKKEDIEQWLTQCGIDNYSLKEDGEYGFVVNCSDNVDIRAKIPNGVIKVKFGFIHGSFRIGTNKLKTLKGCPDMVDGFFDCSENELEDLAFSPPLVSHDFYCDYNKLKSLKGAPNQVGGSFICDNNELTSLQWCPQYVRKSFVCADNFIESIEFMPEMASMFVCKNNPKLGELQNNFDFSTVKKAQQELLEINKNKEQLEKKIKIVNKKTSSKSTKKI